MGRGVSAGGGQSSLGYLFGDGENAKKQPPTVSPKPTETPINPINKDIPAGVRGSPNNYVRSDGQNCGNFITDRPSTKVHAAPGGGSSLDYLFGGGGSGGDGGRRN